jgi:LuxR family maltose regulon positive regulatory protein
MRFKVVARPRLVEKLTAGMRGPLTLISAPVGYGKTTLMSEWHNESGSDFPAAWLSLDSNDNDLERFLKYLTAALESVKPGIGSNTASLLSSPQLPPLEAILTTCINDIDSCDQDIVLVLDDYQVITDPTIHNALSFVLDHCPSKLHLVLLTRVDPPFPLARLRVRNELTEIRAADLRFTVDEVEDFLTNVMQIKLPTADVNALEAQTEGWIAGLQLAALSIQGSDDFSSFIKNFSGSHHYVVDYMIEEVLNRQPEEIKSFLLETSILERMNAHLCNSLTHRTDSQTILERLELRNLFVIPLDEKRQWYRYHHFFTDLLRNRLQHSQSERIPELHHLASAWFQKNGFLAEALEHAISGAQYEDAAAMIEDHGNAMLANGAWGQLLKWLKPLPDEIIHSRPLLAIFYIWGLVLSGQMEDVGNG